LLNETERKRVERSERSRAETSSRGG